MMGSTYDFAVNIIMLIHISINRTHNIHDSVKKLFMQLALMIKPKFYRRFVDDVISRRLKNTHDSLFEKLNNYHEKINFTIETNPRKFLDT